MNRTTSIVLAGAAVFSCALFLAQPSRAQEATQDALSPVEKIYADLAKLSPAERQKQIEDGARKEGKLFLIHTMRGTLGSNHVDLFKKRYPFIDVQMEGDIGSQDATERLYAEETAGRHLTDLIHVALPDMNTLVEKKMVARFPTPATAAVLPAYKGFIDPEGRWTPWYWSEHGVSYNTSLVPPDKAPKTWMDLCNPFFKGSVSFDPAEDRFLSGLYAIMGEAETEKLLKCVGENQPIIQRGHTQRMELMLAGDHMVQGDNYLYQGILIQQKNKAAPYKIAYTVPVMGFGGVAAINRNAQHPYAAALFTDWTLSEESQDYVAKRLRGPVAIKHPYLPDDAKIVTYTDAPKDVSKRMLETWNTYVAKRH